MVSKAIGHFAVLEKIGQGGMGEVYRARDTKLDRVVAIKVLSALKVSDSERQRRFIQEAKAASALNHPNIITVHDILLDGGSSCIVMEHVEGKSLDQLIPRKKGMRLQDLLRAAIQIADALASAHGAGIVHRDLKPANIMVREDGVVKVLDFGLAKLTEESTPADIENTRTVANTEEGTIVGTLGYMSPEQVEGKKIDARSDIFSFGAVLYEMATGQRAFQGDSRMSTMSAVLRDNPKWPEDRVAELPSELSRIVNRCLRKDPERRFQTIKDVKIALDEIREDSESGRLATPVIKPARRNLAPVIAVAAAITIALAAFIGWRLVPAIQPQRQLTLTLRALTDDKGRTHQPTLSPDGRLIAYASDRAGDTRLDIWVQQLTSGASPLRLTSDASDESFPRFSPDGSHIAFISQKNGGGVYIVPTLGGEQRLVVSGQFEQPVFSPDGRSLAVGPFATESQNAFVVPVTGGSARRIVEGFREVRVPLWSPDGKHIVFSGISGKSVGDWWIVPSEGGDASPLGFKNITGGALQLPRDWIGDFILYSSGGDIKRVHILPSPWRIVPPEESLTSSPAIEATPTAIRHPNDATRWMVAMSTGEQDSFLWELPMDYRSGRALNSGGRKYLDDLRSLNPSISTDGKRFSYLRRGIEGMELRARDLTTSAERVLARFPTTPRARLSPDGTLIATNPELGNEDGKLINLISWTTGETRKLCDDCGLIYEWADARRIMYRSGKPMQFWEIEVETGKRRILASDGKHSLGDLLFSPDEKWIALHHTLGENVRPIYITPVRNGAAAPRSEWIPIMDRPGTHIRPWWSPDGRFLYFVSNASGKQAIWGQTLDAVSKTPVGEPFIVFTPALDRLTITGSPVFGPARTQSSIIFSMTETRTNIWLGE